VPARLAADQRRGSHRGHERWLSGIAGTTGRLWDGRTRFYAMKVIHQLIDYFHSHGALTKSQLAYLRQQGFWPGNGGNVEENPAAPVGPEPAEAPDAFAEDLAVQARARTAPRRCRSSGLPGAAPAIGNLCRRLAGLTVHWDEPLHGFVRLARGLQPCASWAEAVVVLRGAATGLLTAAIREALDTGALTLAALDRALDLHDYRAGVVQPSDRSPAANAYRALLTVPDWRESGKHAWILRHSPVDQVFNLIQAKQAVLGALANLYQTDRKPWARYLRGHSHTSLFWAFVLLHNVELDPEAQQCAARRYWSRYRGPVLGEDLVPRASLYAIRMQPDRVLPFLLQRAGLDPAGEAAPEKRLPTDWTLPASWTCARERPDFIFCEFDPNDR